MKSLEKSMESRLSSVLGMGQVLTWGMTYYLPAILFAPLFAEFGWGKPKVVYAFTLSLVISGICAPYIGIAVARYTGKRVLITGTVLNGVGLVTLGFSTTYLQFLAAWAILGAGMSATLYVTAFSTLTEVLGTKARKSISTITLWGGLASTLAWPFGAYFIEHVGWRELCLLYAAITSAVLIPMYYFGLPARHKAISPKKTTPAKKAPHSASPRFMFTLFTASIVLFSFVSGTLSLFLVIMLIEGGLTATEAASLAALMGPSQIAARIVERVLSGAFSPLWTMLAANLLLLSGVGMVLLGGPFLAVGVVVLGTGKGLISIVKGTASLHLFGANTYALKISRVERYVMLTQATAPIISSWVYAISGNTGLLSLLIVFSIIALPLNMFAVKFSPKQTANEPKTP